jgi:hypothetical protein
MKKKITLFSLILLAATGLFVFYSMGGFNEVQLEVLESKDINLSGRHFIGIPQDKKLAKAFQEIEKIKNTYPDAVLHTIYYAEPSGKLDTMEVFVGLESKLMDKSVKYDQVIFTGENVIIATIKSHRFVMPGPSKIKNIIIDHAKENNLPVPDVFIDQIVGLDEVKVIGIKSAK